jgi:hypothetical protein
MRTTPFRDTAKKLARQNDYITMSVECNRVRSHSWWKNVVEYGAWGGPRRGGRVGPPDPEALDGIAELFDTTPDQVARMVAADWYGVGADHDLSHQVLRLGPALDRLTEEDADLVEQFILRLGKD